jgi:hypothetical protein
MKEEGWEGVTIHGTFNNNKATMDYNSYCSTGYLLCKQRFLIIISLARKKRSTSVCANFVNAHFTISRAAIHA